jgi:hypothetical protein
MANGVGDQLQGGPTIAETCHFAALRREMAPNA